MDATPPPTGFSNFSQKCEELFANSIFTCRLILGTSVHEKNFQIGPTVLALKLERKGRVLGGGNHPPPIEQKLTYFSNHEDDIQSQQILA